MLITNTHAGGQDRAHHDVSSFADVFASGWTCQPISTKAVVMLGGMPIQTHRMLPFTHSPRWACLLCFVLVLSLV